jgi:hypothetical protein
MRQTDTLTNLYAASHEVVGRAFFFTWRFL